MIKLTESEIKELLEHPASLQVLIDYHDLQSTEAGAMGYDESAEFHDKRGKELMAEYARVVILRKEEGYEDAELVKKPWKALQ